MLFRLLLSAVIVSGMLLGGCSSYRTSSMSPSERSILRTEVDLAVSKFKQHDPSMQRFFDTAWGWAVFPRIGKGGVGIGGAYGRGEVYEQSRMIGYATLTQGTLGVQLGGQEYSEIIFFENKESLETFKEGDAEFAATASAVASTKGASANADYDNGVAVFTLGEGGLMFEAAIGGQTFGYTDAGTADTNYAIPREDREPD